jgi:hypothetical protein
MPLPFKPQLGKEELLKEAGITDTAMIDLVKYIYQYGHDLNEFSARIRRFLFNGMTHFNRLAYRDAIAACLGLDMRREKDRDALWEQVVKEPRFPRPGK